MPFNRFAIVEGYYCYVMDYHSGQGSKEYRLTGVFHKLGFRPGLHITRDGTDGLEDGAREVYDRLVSGDAFIRDRR